MKIRNTNAKNAINMTYGYYAKSWEEEHSNDFSDYSMLDNVIDNDIDHMVAIGENGIEVITF